MNLNSTSGTYTPDNLIAGSEVPPLVKGVTLAASQGALVRGTVLGKLTKAIGDPVEGDNTGTGTVTAVSLGADAKIGSYVLACIGGSTTKAAAADAWAYKQLRNHGNEPDLGYRDML